MMKQIKAYIRGSPVNRRVEELQRSGAPGIIIVEIAVTTGRLLFSLMLAAAVSAVSTVAGGQARALNASMQRRGQEARQQTQAIRLATDLVSLSVAVTDRSGRAVIGLEKEDFSIYENKVEQPISFFSSEETSASWGLVLDRSGSMMGMMRDVYQAAINVIDEGTEQDEMFILTFNNRVEIACDFTSDRHKLEKSVMGLRAGGETALYDAVAYALDHIKHGKHRKKVLVVVTDGEDNSSRLTFRDLYDRAEEEGVLIYTVGMFERMDARQLALRGTYARGEMEKLAKVTGAFAHSPTSVEKCRETMNEIALEVSRHYSLGYYPTDATRDGKWRKIRVEVRQKGNETKYVARTRAGYRAPSGGEMNH